MNRLKDLRVAAGMSQADLGVSLGCHGTTISKLELEQRQMDPTTICALCDLFGCTADYLLCRSDAQLPPISDEDARLIEAYHDADPRDRAFVDHLLRLDRQDVETPAV